MTDSRSNLAAIFIITALIVSGCRNEEQAAELEPIRTVRAMKVADYAGISRRSFPGRAAATQEVDLAFRVSGPLNTFPVRVGDEVQEGALIASIDPRDFDVAVRNAEGHLERGHANVRLAKVSYDRFVRLGPSAASQLEIDEALQSYEVAQAHISVLEASLESAKDALNDTKLYAPFAGTIVTTHVENFEKVRAGQMIVRLLDNSRIEFEVNIPETLISMVPFVRDARVRFDAFPDLEVPAEITEIGREASATTRTFPVTLIMDQPEEGSILPGMAGRVSATATPPSEQKQLEIVIPVTAVLSPQVENKSYVWVIDPTSNIARRREVQLGKLTSAGYVVGEGLTPGEMIATAGVHFLIEGQAVKPMIQ